MSTRAARSSALTVNSLRRHTRYGLIITAGAEVPTEGYGRPPHPVR
ncbi:hypothetical protein SMF913_26085 [Streptomyces malaysiensis]|uniref:Uncharacterized protein n=1 Tax=Streptomyces malaysiensis TaxID=92644 RepID=A0A2J7YRI5_STRMQ|nr:hypothetical protein SMF913_26085 [Streptomyces malaysiensis]